MKKISCFTVLILLISKSVFAQVGINNDNSVADPSAMLDVKSNNLGALLPRLTTAQILSIQNPANGLIAYCLDDGKFYVYVANFGRWKEIPYGLGVLGQSFSCGLPFTVKHFGGAIAPEDKTVTYGTVTGIPGEPDKCWITQNLGSDHQAVAVSDTTEAAAGWYWQFNRKPGYKHDGILLTPVWTITSINENSNWLLINDPCSILLSSPWRIPTYAEWNNVVNSGGWTNWNDSWNSNLKLHAAGYINLYDGILLFRGSVGYFWSSTQIGTNYGKDFRLGSYYSNMGDSYKATGFPLRCLREN